MMDRRLMANAIRALSMDAVQRANSGHPGAPMGMADIAEVLWNDFLSHNPANPGWWDRDRFVLSNGHASMLIYSLLHLSGYDLTIDDIKAFRQLGSKTPGHPEYGQTPGVETTTGPLGQGFANAVGMAIAESVLSARFNRSIGGRDLNIVDHRTWVFVGDGCLMEGISHEAASLAGTLGLGKLICIYDDNGISIDGEVSGWFQDDTPARFAAYGWQVIPDIDGHDPAMIHGAMQSAVGDTGRPTLICCKTHIGFGSPAKQDSAGSHGSPLGNDEVEATRRNLDWTSAAFVIPADIYRAWSARAKGAAAEDRWNHLYADYSQIFPEDAKEFERCQQGELPGSLAAQWDQFVASGSEKAEATRHASSAVIARLQDMLPELIGGSADLSGSNLTLVDNSVPLTRGAMGGNYLFYGVREFGMSAISNGIALHGGLIPFSATFLTFMEYGRNAVRMAALMGLRNVFVYTHDSIGQGEDGPTHQPVEQLTNLRTTPNMSVWRPCDSAETRVAWHAAITRRTGPTSLVLTRQSVEQQTRNPEQISNIGRGGYILRECVNPAVVLVATGSEVAVAMAAAAELDGRVACQVVSMPSTDLFASQPDDYRDQVLPASIPRVVIEAAHGDYWYKWAGAGGRIVSLDTFGESGPGGELFRHFGFTAARVCNEVESLLGIAGSDS